MDLENISSDIMDKVITEMNSYDYNSFSDEDIKEALNKDYLSIKDFQAFLSPKAINYLEEMAQKAKLFRERYFGNSVYIFTPLYISNYCDNYCVYCGFNSHNKIKRARLNFEQIEQELKEIAKSGLQEILILTGESERYSDVEYIREACKLARKYFNNVGIEIYPVNVKDYEYLNSCGADYVTIFQETYNNEKYKKLHLEGHKKVFSYRFNSQERALMGGMRGVAFGALLGLDDFRKDAFATGYHAYLLQKKYPYAEISISCPRLRPVINNLKIEKEIINKKELFQIICAYRLFLPFANITISTRENSIFRDNIIKIAATKISAGVDTGIGAHTKYSTKKGDEQFEIADKRTVAQIFEKIKSEELQPVMNDYIYLKD
ncbi:thiamine biosynthesis protein ThiH [Fusobacterium sp. HMSC065F01]|uniref:2-iminoacetate synthase ThiH n=1 Tax=Fusobacterium sp. HMSC065F01 TaxID=1739435 RepID=UPI0008A0FE6C|nr:2-iminoacetate synthase ThiH [Fusobacterium sp. HMSC065F01]OFQ55234.1 thiamine biosynthesis protein ThiH [Fusobacterium sp. HMSC065F01]